MHNQRFTILLFALAGALLSGGCAVEPTRDEVLAEPGQAAAAPLSEVDLVKNTAPLPVKKDLRYQLPAGQNRALTIYISSQSFEYVEDDQVFLSGPVSTGTKEHPTPTGDYRVLSKDADKRSGKYTNSFDDNTPMPYSLQFHGPYFVHEGWVPVPAVADSHGCVRLRTEDARLLFDRIRIGDRILVKGAGAARLASVSPNPPAVF
ncbi:L,D-transpeptidase [uncultured Thiodictyon sp.]|uniref:L,D-transpeptidase n=1 Tax=uncultured Thiodictyon sp. TaxID=1846217 RepID=UPI0025E6FFCC|nr:L,D-transpeptidase [uncultured Thiodictyon sp.]